MAMMTWMAMMTMMAVIRMTIAISMAGDGNDENNDSDRGDN